MASVVRDGVRARPARRYGSVIRPTTRGGGGCACYELEEALERRRSALQEARRLPRRRTFRVVFAPFRQPSQAGRRGPRGQFESGSLGALQDQLRAVLTRFGSAGRHGRRRRAVDPDRHTWVSEGYPSRRCASWLRDGEGRDGDVPSSSCRRVWSEAQPVTADDIDESAWIWDEHDAGRGRIGNASHASLRLEPAEQTSSLVHRARTPNGLLFGTRRSERRQERSLGEAEASRERSVRGARWHAADRAAFELIGEAVRQDAGGAQA